MKPQLSNSIAKITLGLGTLATVAALAYAGGASGLFSIFTIWTLFPYAILLATPSFAHTKGRANITLVASTLAVGFAIFAYVDALFVHTSSTSGLAFIFIPLYQLIAAVLLLAALYFSRTSDKKQT